MDDNVSPTLKRLAELEHRIIELEEENAIFRGVLGSALKAADNAALLGITVNHVLVPLLGSLYRRERPNLDRELQTARLACEALGEAAPDDWREEFDSIDRALRLPPADPE